MSISQFGETIVLIHEIMELCHDLYMDKSNPLYSAVMNDLYSAIDALCGDRPATIADVSSRLSEMSRSFVNYITSRGAIERMGQTRYLNEADDMRGYALDGLIDPFVLKYLRRERNRMTEQQEVGLARILAASPFKQREVELEDQIDTLLIREPDITNFWTGRIRIKPDEYFKIANGWNSIIRSLKNAPIGNVTAVYVSSDSLYIVHRRLVDAINANTNFGVPMPVNAQNTTFIGYIELVDHFDEKTITVADGTNILNNGTIGNNYPLIRADNNGPEYNVGTKRHITLRLSQLLTVSFPQMVQYRAENRNLIIRMKGRFYINRCGYESMQDMTAMVFPNVDSWNRNLDALPLTVNSIISTCDNNIVDRLNVAYTDIIQRAINAETIVNEVPFAFVLDTNFADIGQTLATLSESTTAVFHTTERSRMRIMQLAYNVSIIMSVMLAFYSNR